MSLVAAESDNSSSDDVDAQRSYGSNEGGIAVGDIVEVQKAGEWLDEPATVIGRSDDGTFDVRMGYRGGLTWGLSRDSDGEEPDPYESGMVFKGKTFPAEVRSGERFRSQIESSGYTGSACCDCWLTRCWLDWS
jgi:hypothetical protein